ncbi:MAG: NUDIX hydrolase [Chitinophagaceae bacterium]|nr:NUDIX hydrolase [Chitinophagaceae bacterium]
MSEHINPWKVVKQKPVYDNPWIAVTEYDVINPSGGEGIYGKVSFKNLAVGVVPLNEEGYTWLVGQYRFPIDAYSWEIPEGGGAPGIDPVVSAQRELLEETGLKARKWDKILDMHLSNSVTNETGVVYLARELSQHEAQPEETEQLVIKKVKFEGAFQMVLRGEITDSLSVAAILKLEYLLKNHLV